MNPPDLVELTFLVTRDAYAAIRQNPAAFQGIQERVRSGQIASVVKATLADRGVADGNASQGGGSLVPIRMVLDRQQAASLFANAQAMAISERLGDIGHELAAVNDRMAGMEVGIGRIDRTTGQALAALRRGPLSALRAAWTSAVAARRRGDQVTLAAAAREAERAARDLLGFAEALADGTHGLPFALQAPAEWADPLMRNSHSAMLAASTIYLALDEPEIGSALMREQAAAMHGMRESLRTALGSAQHLKHRLSGTMAPDAVVIAAGRQATADARQAGIDAEALARGVTMDADGFFSFSGTRLAFLQLEPGVAAAAGDNLTGLDPGA